MKPFGQGSLADENGYDLPFIVGWLEDMAGHEDLVLGCISIGKRFDRLQKVQEAIGLLNEACEIGGEV